MRSYVNRMVLDRWAGLLCHEDEVVWPTIDEIEDAFRKLNAKDRTMISLYGSEGAYLTIGGGEGRYVVYKSAGDEVIWNLRSVRDDQSKFVLINIGGQEGEFSVDQVIDETQVLQAIRTFFLDGLLDPALCWKRQ